MREWSAQQSLAIGEKNCSLLVSAGAGSGKTAVLVERIIRLVAFEGVDLDNFLVVTFTQAAASEMRERIGEAILEQLNNHPEQEEHLRRQMHLLKNASISTIHAFCSDILRGYFHAIGLDPQFRVADENEARLLKNEALEMLLESQYEKSDPDFAGLAEMFSSSKNDEALAALIERLHIFIHSLPDPWQWLQQQADMFAAPYQTFRQSPWVGSLMKHIKVQLLGIRGLLLAARELAGSEKSLQGYLKTIEADLDNNSQLLSAYKIGPEELLEAVKQVQIPRLNRAGKDAGEAVKNHVKALRDEAKSSLVKLQKAIEGKSLKIWHQDIVEMGPYIRCLIRLVEEFQNIYADLKARRNILNFNDLEHKALKILEFPVIAEELRSRYSYIFVDEYQDSNMVQEQLIKSICRDHNLFLVGDIKQSIYRFRLADPMLFLSKYREYPQSRGLGRLRVDLTANYRSDSQILHAVNLIFQSIMSEDLGEIDYTKAEFLYTGWENERQSRMGNLPVKVAIIDKASEDENDDLTAMENAEAEARLVGCYIKDSLGQIFLDHRSGKEKPLEYRDMVVLLRATQKWGHIFYETLMEMGIPVYADINTGYFDAVEVKLLLNLLRVIDNKQQDIPLMSTMRSSIGGFTIEEMTEIRLELPESSYYEALSCYARNHDNQLSRKAQEFINRLARWQDRANFLPVDELIWEVILESGYLYFVNALPGGEQRVGNVRILLDRARQFQTTSFSGLYHFINYLERVEQSSGDMGVAKTLGEGDNLVRVMSIHKSKGLEFPLVIIAGLGKKFNTRDISAPMLLHRDLGFGPRFIDLELRCYHDTLARQVIGQRVLNEGLSEEMRILYVAMTRAQSRLILVGTTADLEKSCSRWIRPMDAFNLAKARSFLDWLGPVLIRHLDGEKLRCCLPDRDMVDMFDQDDSRWDIEIVDNRLIFSRSQDLMQGQKETSGGQFKWREADDRTVVERLNWEYPWRHASQIPSKLSATQIRKIKNKGDRMPGQYQDIPALRRRLNYISDRHGEKKVISAAERGTIMHFAMQKLDLKRVSSRYQICEQIEDMIGRELIDKSYADYIDVEKIWRFFQSELGRRIAASREVFRELPFNLVQAAGQVLDIENCTESLLVQGVIDMCFVEGNDIVLLDYKTDSIFYEEEIGEIVDKYRPQLEIYRQALEQLMNRKVKESYLYLFSRDMAIQL